MAFSDNKRRKFSNKYDPINFFVETFNYDVWFENEKSTETATRIEKVGSTDKEESVDLSDIPPLESDEKEVKERKGLKILTPKKLLTRFPILLAEIKAENNSGKLKTEIRPILYLFISA